MKSTIFSSLALTCALALTACGNPDVDNTGTGSADETTTTTTTEGEEGEAGEESTTGGGSCDGTHDPNEGGAADGATCTADADCESNFCLSFADAPVDPGAVCAPAAGNCATRAAGTVRDFVTREPVADLDIKVAGAIAASVNPNSAAALAMGTTDANGQFDITSDERIEQPLGIVGIVTGTGRYLSATGLQSPSVMNFYPPGTGIHDVWSVSEATLTAWNTALASDTLLADFLPLGDEGGVIGMVRDGTTGIPAAGYTVASKNGDSSNALIRYLNEAGDAFDATETSSSGIFITVNPGLGEEFEAQMGGTAVDGADGTAGSTSGSLFILILDI